MSKPEAPEAAYHVVVNARGVAGSRERCLAHIEETWTSLVPVEAGPP